MSKKIKLSSTKIDQFKTNSARKAGTRNLIARFLIVCEGEKTERLYFESFPKRMGNIEIQIDSEGGKMDTVKVVDTAIKLRENNPNRYDSVWAVFDKDSFPDFKFNQAIEKANNYGIKCAWSNEAFELWYLLHFQYRNTGMSRVEYSKAISTEVTKSMQNKKLKYSYKKNDGQTYFYLTEYGSQDDAIKNAKKLEKQYQDNQYHLHNPCTTVYKLVEELTGKSKKFIDEINDKFNRGE